MSILLFPMTAVTSVVMVVFSGRAVRRLLGVRIGTLRTLLAGALILALQGPLIRSVARGNHQDENAYTGMGLLALSLAVSAVVAMVVLVIAEALVPTGTLAGPVAMWRGGRDRLARTRRYVQIARIVIRHGLGPYGTRRGRAGRGERDRLARSLRLAIEDGGPAFVKFGQLLSTRFDLLPAAFTSELGSLRDQVPASDWSAIEPLLRTELGAPVSAVFESFDRDPIAAASVAQVHAARLRDGTDVVVKIQRPGAADVMAADLDILSRLSRCVQARAEWAKRIDLVALVDAYARALRDEFDFALEASNAKSIGASVTGSASGIALRVPWIHPSLSTGRVLVMERFRGRTLAGGRGIGDARRDQISRSLLSSLLAQILRDGVFHADLHQGNIMLLDDGSVGLLDFGSVVRVDTELRAGLQRLLLAIDRDDPTAVADALLTVVQAPADLERAYLTREVGRCLMRHVGPGTTARAAMLVDLLRVVTSFGLRVPAEVAAAFRAVATLEGVLTAWNPGFEVVTEAREAAARIGPASGGHTQVRDEFARLLPAVRDIPRTIERIGRMAGDGRLTLGPHVTFADADRRRMREMVHQVMAGVIGSALGFMALLLLRMPGSPLVSDTMDLHELLGYGLLTAGAVLVTRSLVPLFTHQPR